MTWLFIKLYIPCYCIDLNHRNDLFFAEPPPIFRKVFLASLLVVFTSISYLFCQPDFIHYVQSKYIFLNSEDDKNIETIVGSTRTQESYLVQINSLKGKQLVYKLSLPGQKKPSILRSSDFRVVESSMGSNQRLNYWIGEINHAGDNGEFILVSDESGSRFGGHFQLNGKSFDLIPIRENISILREVNMDGVQRGVCGLKEKDDEGAQSKRRFGRSIGTCSSPSAKIVFLLPPDYYSWMDSEFGTNYWAKIIFHGLVRYSFRNALQFSGHPNAATTIVDVVNYPFNYSSSLDIDDQLDILTSPTVGPKQVSINNADCAVLITSNQYYETASGQGLVTGSVPCIGSSSPSSSCRYAIVTVDYAIGPQWTVAHEIGHIFGGRHQRGIGGDNNPDFGHAYQFGSERTILYTGLASKDFRFSNPSIFVNGVATGTSTSNNADRIVQAMCGMGDFGQIGDLHQAFFKQKINLGIRPNPVFDEVTIEVGTTLKNGDLIQIFNLEGKKVIELTYYGDNHWQTISVNELKPGTYFIKSNRITDPVRKFIKQ